MAYQNVFEEEMVKLAEEMSLLEECDLTWNSNNLDETKERLRAYEDIVDEHLGLREREYVEEDDGAPISDSQLKALFFGQSEDDFSPPSRSGRRGTSSRRTSEHNMSRNSTRGGEQKIKDTVNTICRSLRWYQTKIVNEIETTSEVSYRSSALHNDLNIFAGPQVGKLAGAERSCGQCVDQSRLAGAKRGCARPHLVHHVFPRCHSKYPCSECSY